ncbi:transcriptional regulator-like protein [Caballeronia pedi]|uniref:Transcriptional regulator-like protein n=1 Tax=Caballeronia pedi TaxID=1777141 RepID=A0A157ZR70_9BURK|nr:WYL domain-containing protein [Caballeronia pedi]SAK47995.1 transcriptional regulator-like protein [Caballeronia pedi]
MATEDVPAVGHGEPRISSRWGQERRLEFIDFRLQWDGRINRSALTDFFGISTPQASADIAKYQDLRPQNMEYDRSLKVYVRAHEFAPAFPVSQPSRYLNELLATATGILPRDATFVGWWPSVAVAPFPSRRLDVEVLAALLKAIRSQEGLRICYQSMSRTEPTSRTISPHALGFDGFRWHVRAYCHLRDRFLDFVIARILRIDGTEASGQLQERDSEWHTTVTLKIAPNPGLIEAKRRVVELDYGMENGELEFRCKQALLFYCMKHLGLAADSGVKPEEQQIVLKNRAEVERFLPFRAP